MISLTITASTAGTELADESAPLDVPRNVDEVVVLDFGGPVLRTPYHGYEYPNWAYNAMGGIPAIIDPGMFMASKTIAGTILDLLTVEGELEKATQEFNERTGGGVGGSTWVAPLLGRDFTPPVDLRWPEYIQTERGEEWWIPTPAPGLSERIA